MRFPEEKQQTGPEPTIPEPTPEPRLLTRPDRQPPPAPRRQPNSTEPVQKPKKKRVRHHHRGRARKHARRLGIATLAALASGAVLLLAALTFVFYLRHTMAAALPQIDGTIQAAGLHAPVTVSRDPHGVPTITAANLPDLLFAQGYTTAGDRLWQMDGLRRHAAGALAEILGSSMLEHDRRQRFLQIRAAADRAVAQLPPDQLAQLQAYANGVNAYIGTHRTLPLQFRMLGYAPAPWTPRDSLLVSLAMWQDLSTSFPRKMDREALGTHLPADLLPDLYPVGSWRDKPPAAQGHDITAPHEVEQIPLDPSQSRLHLPNVSPENLLAVSTALAGTGRCEGCRSGSNNWAVSGAHTASGAPLVSNDMHLSLAIPDIWYEASLHADLDSTTTPRLDVTGFTLPGCPFVIVGRNTHVAWGVTNLGADVQDLRIEHLRGSGDTTEYERPDNTWAPVNHRPETIKVRGGRNVTLDVLTTDHAAPASVMETPVISSLYPGETRALSLAWTIYDPSAVSSLFLAVNTAADGPSLVASMAHFGGPSLNLVYADRTGHIGYHALGLIPVRGPAVQHPRAVQAPIVQPGATPPDESTDEGTGPEASVENPASHLVLSAFRPTRPVTRRRQFIPRHPQAIRQPAPRAKAAPRPVQETLIPTNPVINYTIGSPLSPLPVDALDPQQAWTAYIPYDALPQVVDPKNGILATANARVTADDSPYALATDWADPFRVERIVHLLAGRKNLTSNDMLGMETDVYSDVNRALAQRLAYAVDHASTKALGEDASRLHKAANILRNWDGQMRTDSAGAAIVTTARQALWPALLVPQIEAHDNADGPEALRFTELYTWGERTSALELLLQHRPARWLPKAYANWNDFLAIILAASLKEAHAPSTLAKWQYGQVHTVELADPVFGTHHLLARAFGIRATSGRQPAPGDATTIDAIGAHFGPSQRFTADLSSPDAALGNITTGQSANPRSPWYFDQFGTWLAGQSFPLPAQNTEAAHKLTLTP